MELWYTEQHTPNVGLTLRVKETLCVKKSAYQDIVVLDTYEYGRMLLLDGMVMTTDRDEFVYHEMITHPSLFVHPDPREVLVVGGGDGGAVREVLKHRSVNNVTLCEIDETVIEVCKEYFPNISCELSGNPKVSIAVEDGALFLDRHPGTFDIIIVDSTDPVGPAVSLFSQDFFSKCLASLKEGGILVAQSESPLYHLDTIRDMKKSLMEAGFKKVRFYWGVVPTYPSGMWSWVIASNAVDPVEDFSKERFYKSPVPTKYYTPEIHLSAFSLPAFFENALS